MDVRGPVAVDLADETEGEVELILVLPAGAADAAHGGEELRPHGLGWPEGDEQPVHGGRT
jgi:hypothetical protein